MTLDLNSRFYNWLNDISKVWGVTIDEVVEELARNEIENREDCFPEMKMALSPLDLDSFSKSCQKCWPLGSGYDKTRVNIFLKNRKASSQVIQNLIDNFPKTDKDAIERIDKFIENAGNKGYVNEKNRPDKSGAALLASVILTSLMEDRFVDFRMNRWEALYKEFYDDDSLPKMKTYGQKIVWAGNFAKNLANTQTFQRYWSDEPPLWVVAGLAWVGPSPDLNISSDVIDDDFQKSYPEGRWKERLHKYRERNSKVVKAAKSLRLKKDPFLKCDVCGFSFVSRYGDRGDRFIEAHHTIPIGALSPGDKTKIEDIALVCSNCHRMIHRGDETLSIAELKGLLKH